MKERKNQGRTTEEQRAERRELILKTVKEIGAYIQSENCYLISVRAISIKLVMARNTIKKDLKEMHNDGIIEFVPGRNVSKVRIK